jgi:hypothetical protein
VYRLQGWDGMGALMIRGLIEQVRNNREFAIGLGAIASLMIVLVTGGDLLWGTIPGGNGLYYRYSFYTAAMIAFFHFLFFLIAGRTAKHKKRLPKYLEYAYTLVISIGLIQIFFSAPHLVSYIKFVGGEEQELIQKIQKQAQGYLQKECRTNEYRYTLRYCFKVTMLALASDPREYIIEFVLPDDEFLNHTVKVVAGPQTAYIEKSPILTYAKQLQALIEYTQQPNSNNSSGVLTWIGLLLLPIGIALRLVKTSLELFGRLDDAPQQLEDSKVSEDISEQEHSAAPQKTHS